MTDGRPLDFTSRVTGGPSSTSQASPVASAAPTTTAMSGAKTSSFTPNIAPRGSLTPGFNKPRRLSELNLRQFDHEQQANPRVRPRFLPALAYLPGFLIVFRPRSLFPDHVAILYRRVLFPSACPPLPWSTIFIRPLRRPVTILGVPVLCRRFFVAFRFRCASSRSTWVSLCSFNAVSTAMFASLMPLVAPLQAGIRVDREASHGVSIEFGQVPRFNFLFSPLLV